MDGHKRKRDDDGSVVTFYAPDRTFARVYKGQSLEETKDLVRRKLGVSEDTLVRLTRLHEGKVIELDDDEDFEAFRHLARHVPALDVAVFVGQSGPSFSRQTSGESSTDPNTSKKRNKHRRAVPSTSIISNKAPTRDITSRKEQVSGAPGVASTLDADGVPKKKRKRKGMSPHSELVVPSVAHTLAATQPEPEGHEPSVTSKKNPKPRSHATLSATPSLEVFQDAIPSTTEAPGPSKSSKRKRQDTPESPAVLGRGVSALASSSIPLPPLSSSSPVKKKRRKEKRSEDSVPAASVEKQSAVRPDKKGKRTADDAMPTPAEVVPVLTAEAGDDVAARRAAKKAKREAKAKGRETTETVERAVSSKESGKPVKRGKSKDTEKAQVADVKPSASQIPAGIKLDKRKKSVEGAIETQMAPVPVAPADGTSAKSGKQKKSETKSRESDQLTVTPVEDADKVDSTAGPSGAAELEADGEPNRTAALNDPRIGISATEATAKTSKRRKLLSNVSSVDAQGTAPTDSPPEAPSAEGAAVPDSQGGSSSASVKKYKGDRKKSLPTSALSSEPAETAPAAGMSVVQAAAEAVLARALSTSAGPASALPSQQPTRPSTEPTVPTRKKKGAKSKLSQVWGPSDLAEGQEQASVSTGVPAPSSSAPETLATPAVDTTQAKSKKSLRLSSAPTCPMCDKASSHPRSQCPVVGAGPAAIRKRITEMKKSGYSELVEELQALLKETHRRRKSAGAGRAAEATGPASVSAVDVPARERLSSPEVPLQSLSTSSQSRPTLGDRSLSSPRVPAGLEISEVVVQSRDEGSSNESSSDNDEGAPASSFAHLSSLVQILDSDNFEALLHGPLKPGTSILARIPFSSESSSSGEESDNEGDKGDDIDMDEDEKNDRAFRRMSRRFARAASSSDEDEPQLEPDQELDAAEADMDDSLALPPQIGPNPSISMDTQDARQVEADVLAQDTSAAERSVEQSREESYVALEDGGDSSEGEDQGENNVNAHSGVGSDEEAEPKPVANLEDQSNESEADDQDPLPADRGDDHRVEHGAEVDPLASQGRLKVFVEVSEERKGPEGGVDVDGEPQQHFAGVGEAEVSVEVSKLPRGSEPRLLVDLPQDRTSNDSDPDVGASPGGALADLSGTTAQAELEKFAAPFEDQDRADGEGNQDTIEVEVFEPHTEDPDDPIDTFSSDHDREQRDVLEDDPIEDSDLTQERQRTPPPAPPRTPGTVGRMKDRHGHVSQARNHQTNLRLSEQLLGDLTVPQEEITLATPAAGSAPEPSLELEVASDIQARAEGEADVAEAAEVAEPVRMREDTTSSQSQSQPEQAEGIIEARPRRTTRTTVRRTSSAGPPSSLPQPQATPTPAPAPRRRGVRLTAEEKAQREADKAQKGAEKKAERERKAAEKAAEKAVKEAEKKAERERKAAERQAEKESRQAEKQTKQKEKAPAKRGRTERGRGGSTKPISTRSQRAMESTEPGGVDEQNPRGENEEIPSASQNVTETPGVARVSWAVLPQSESRTQEGSVGEISMIDELQPSSPEATPHHALVESPAVEATVTQEPSKERENLPTVTPKPRGKQEPLFIPSSSQYPPTPFGLPDAESTPFTDGDGQGDGESDPDAEPDRTFKAPSRPRASWASQSLYPLLTDLASQSLFSATQIPSPVLFQTPKQGTGYTLSPAAYGKTNGDDDDDDDDESSDESDSSDSDSGKKKSHIPQNRRAGAGAKKKKSGFLSAYT